MAHSRMKTQKKGRKRAPTWPKGRSAGRMRSTLRSVRCSLNHLGVFPEFCYRSKEGAQRMMQRVLFEGLRFAQYVVLRALVNGKDLSTSFAGSKEQTFCRQCLNAVIEPMRAREPTEIDGIFCGENKELLPEG